MFSRISCWAIVAERCCWQPTENCIWEILDLDVKEGKIIHDSVHGSISVDGVFLDLIQTAEFQRLHDIKQLALAYLVFPGAHQTRLEHSLGTYHIAGRMCDSLELDEDEAMKIRCAALLHDVGHAPFSHTLEWFLRDQFGFTHDELTARIITGKESIIPSDESKSLKGVPTIPEILKDYGLDPKEIAGLIGGSGSHRDPEQTLLLAKKSHFNGKNYPFQMIQGPVDCDQIDFLIRDSHYTGVAHGVIDLDRLLQTLDTHNGDLVVEYRGVPAVEGMLVARALMYTSVYLHKTVRIAELMLAKAAENLNRADIDAARKQNDSGFLAVLRDHDASSRRIVTSLKYRRLYKSAFLWKMSELDERQLALLAKLCSYREKVKVEESICERAGIPADSVVIDVPGEEIVTSEPRMSSVNIGILEEKKVRPLSRVSPLASALQLRKVQDWGLRVACPPEFKDKVRKAAERVLGSK